MAGERERKAGRPFALRGRWVVPVIESRCDGVMAGEGAVFQGRKRVVAVIVRQDRGWECLALPGQTCTLDDALRDIPGLRARLSDLLSGTPPTNEERGTPG